MQKTILTEKQQRQVYVLAFGQEFDSKERKQQPLPLSIAYKTAVQELRTRLEVNGRYLSFKLDDLANLVVTATPEGIELINDLGPDRPNYNIWWELSEDIICNSAYSWLRPEHIGALISDSCPILGFDTVEHENDRFGTYEGIDTRSIVWYFQAYAILDEFEVLAAGDPVILTVCENEPVK
ncbi:MAG: hypothetical protein H6550_16250 [Chitinophagales bacterium]|nr:hypothetical protein [Chitinophagales bacterium]